MLTSAGKTFLGLGAVALIVGLLLGYETLTALGLAFLAAVVIGRLWIIRRPRVSATRSVVPERVRSGRPARSELTITNRGRRRTTGGLALERFGDGQLPVQLPGLEPGESAVITTELPTERRGVFRVGPLDDRPPPGKGSGVRFRWSGFGGQVSAFRFQVSVFRFGAFPPDT